MLSDKPISIKLDTHQYTMDENTLLWKWQGINIYWMISNDSKTIWLTVKLEAITFPILNDG